MNIQQTAKELQPAISSWRRDLHQIPELGNELPMTSQYVQDRLTEMGIPFTTCADGSGVIALIGNGGGRTVGYRADMDALPVRELTGLPYASTNGCMHACGHDAHAATALGVAKILKGIEKDLPGQVKILFQPGEETLEGAKAMIADGALENPHVDCMVAMHMMPQQGAADGSIVFLRANSHIATASSDAYIIRVKGRGGHASTPDLCVDPVPILAQIVDALQRVVSREISPLLPAVLTIAGIRAGNDSFNVIPDCGEIRGTYRTLNPEIRTYITRRLHEIPEAVCAGMHAECEVKIVEGVPSLVNNFDILDVVAGAYSEMEWKQDIIIKDTPMMGGEDAACFFNLVPGGYFNFVSNQPVDGTCYPVHNAKYALDDTLLYQASALIAETVIRLMKGECS